MIELEKKNIGLKQDLFIDRKGVHIKLSNDVHLALRTLCFRKGITMQGVFEEFARLLANDDVKALGIVDRMILDRLDIPNRRSKTKKQSATELNENEKESIYDLINNETLEEET